MMRTSTLPTASAAWSIPAGQMATETVGGSCDRSIGEATFEAAALCHLLKADEMLTRRRGEVQAAFEPQLEYSEAAFAWRAAASQRCRQFAILLSETKLTDPCKHLRIHRNLSLGSRRPVTARSIQRASRYESRPQAKRYRMDTAGGVQLAILEGQASDDKIVLPQAAAISII